MNNFSIRNDIPAKIRIDIKNKALYKIVYKITLDKTRWFIDDIYCPPSVANNTFYDSLNILLNLGSKFIENYMAMDDLNYDFMV